MREDAFERDATRCGSSKSLAIERAPIAMVKCFGKPARTNSQLASSQRACGTAQRSCYCETAGPREPRWTRDNRAEIDFVVERQGCVSAIEVKAGENTRSRSLSSLKKSHPGVRLIRLSTKPFGMNEGLRSIPLYAAFCL